MTCRDCIHYGICTFNLTGNEWSKCFHFKNKADVEEVVRCKDCEFNVANKENDPLNITDYSGDDIVCSYFLTDGLDPNDYCSRGTRTPRERGGQK